MHPFMQAASFADLAGLLNYNVIRKTSMTHKTRKTCSPYEEGGVYAIIDYHRIQKPACLA